MPQSVEGMRMKCRRSDDQSGLRGSTNSELKAVELQLEMEWVRTEVNFGF